VYNDHSQNSRDAGKTCLKTVAQYRGTFPPQKDGELQVEVQNENNKKPLDYFCVVLKLTHCETMSEYATIATNQLSVDL
jgi:hypothetical protein